MKLDFTSLVLDNFKSFLGVHVLNLREFGDGLHYIRGRNDDEPRLGPNGVGKSSLVSDAVSWCLFGKTTSGLRNPDLRPWQPVKGPTRVSLSVAVDKEKHAISRSINPNRLAIDRKECGQDDVIKLIGLDFDMFTNTVLLGQGRPLFFDLQPREKMDLFVGALALNRWDDRAQRASDRVQEMATLQTELDGIASGLKTALDELDALIAETEKKRDGWTREQQAEMKAQRTLLKQAEKMAKSNRECRDDADLALDSAETELRHYKKQLVKQEETLLKADRMFQKAETAYQRRNDEITGAYQELAEMGEGDVCKSCGQTLRGTAFAEHRANLKKKVKQLEASDTLEREFTRTQKTMEAWEAAVKSTREAVEEYQAKASRARDDLDTYGKQQAELDAQLKSLQKGTREREERINPHVATLRDLNKRARSLETQLRDADLASTLAHRKGERAKFWIKGFKDVRLYVLEEILQELEMATNALLDEAGLVGWHVSYLVERETARGNVSHGLSIMIRSPRSKGAVKWEAWSGGEGQRLRIVGALALSEVLLNHAGVRTTLEVLDEPTQHLSDEGVDDLCEYLSERARRLHKKVFYIDHQSIESTRFASVTTIIRGPEGSRIEFTA